MIRLGAQLFSFALVLAATGAPLLSGGARPAQTFANSPQSSDFEPRSVPVYVVPFEIHSGAEAQSRKSPPQRPAKRSQDNSKETSESQPVWEDSDTAAAQVRSLKKFFSDSLVQAFQKQGFPAAPQGGTAAQKGILIRGVFAEVDSRSRNCLGLLGGTAPSTQFILYVGIFNLSRPDQPLYQPVLTESCDARYGQLISLNNYVPMNKYEMSKDPKEEEIRKICARIVSQLTTLLQANPSAFAQ